LLGAPEGLCRFHPGDNPLGFEASIGRKLFDFGLGLRFLLWRVEEDGRAVLRAPIWPLAVQRGGIVKRKERVQQLIKAHLLRVEVQFHHFRVSGLVRAHVLVGGLLQRAALIASRRGLDSRERSKRRLYAPETS